MRFLHDVARRLSIVAMLIAVTVIGRIERAALAQAPAAQPSATQPAADQPAATQRLPQPGRAAATGAKPAAKQAAPPSNGPRVATNGPQAATAAGAPAAGPVPPVPAPPFQLNTREQELLDKTLAQWETKNSATKKFKCKFERYEYDSMLKQYSEAKDNLRSKSTGEVKYKQPDHGMFRIVETTEFNANDNKYEKRTEGLEHWVCDGAAIYEFVPADKKLKIHPLPEEMQGEAIADGPIPFIFGAKVDKMKQRYWIRDVTPKEEIGKHTWLEAFPKYQHDAGNFSSALLLLHTDFTIKGLQIILPGGQQRTAFIFSDVVINDPLVNSQRGLCRSDCLVRMDERSRSAPDAQPEVKQPAAAAAKSASGANDRSPAEGRGPSHSRQTLAPHRLASRSKSRGWPVPGSVRSLLDLSVRSRTRASDDAGKRSDKRPAKN